MGGVPGAIGGGIGSAIAGSPILKAFSAMAGGGSGTGATPFDVGAAPAVDTALPQLEALPLAPVDGQQVSTPVAQVQQTSGGYRDMIERAATKWGVDPNTALRVAKSEGGTDKWIQSGARHKKTGRVEPSYGPFQMLIGGGNTGFSEGMGNQIIRERGIDPRDPRNAEAVIDFAMEQASKHGWGQWYGAAKAGIGEFDGIGGRPAGVSPMVTNVMGDPGRVANDPAAYKARMDQRMFGGAMQPGEGETLQKQLAAQDQQSAQMRSGMSMQQGSAEAPQAGPVYDDSEQYLEAAKTRAASGPRSRGEERKASLRQKLRGEE